MQKISEEQFKNLYGDKAVSMFSQKKETSTGEKLTGFATGFAKGALQTGVETASLLQKGGQTVMAAVDPTKTFKDVQSQTGFPTLQGEKLTQIREMLTAQDSAEKAGKLTEFIAEFLIPVGKSKVVVGAVDKGLLVGDKLFQKGEVAATNLAETAGKKFKNLVTEPLQPQYENAVRRTTPQKFDEYANAAKKAASDFQNATPLELAGKKAQDALGKIQEKVDAIGKLKKSAVLTYGDKNVGTITTKFTQTLESSLKNSLIEGDNKLVKELATRAKLLGHNPTAKDVDDFIDFAQDVIYTSSRNLSIPVTDSTTALLRKEVGKLNSALKSQLPPGYAKINDKYSKIIDVRNELNAKLGKEGEQGGSLMKRVFSPSDARTKQMFAEVKELTGIDLVDEATLARMMMEIVGDSRQASMLQQLNLPSPTKTGIVNWLVNKGVGKLNTPEARLKKARELIGQLKK